MDLIADALLIAGAIGAAFYCRTLARRLGALRDLDSGLGAAIATLSRQVDEMRVSLDAAKSISGNQTNEITQLVARAEMAAGRLELLLASLHEGERRRPIGDVAKRRDTYPAESTHRHATAPEPTPDTVSDDASDADEEAMVQAVLRSLARESRKAGLAEPTPATKKRPSIFDDAFDEIGEYAAAKKATP